MSIVFVRPRANYSFFSRLLGFSNFFQKMSEIAISSSSNSTEKAIDEYYDKSSDSSSDTSNSSGGNTTNEEYVSGVPGFPIEVVQEQLRKASGSQASTSSFIPPSSPLDEAEITVYSCAIDISSKTDEQRLNNLRTTLGSGTRSRTSLIPDCPSVESGVVTLILG